MNRVLSTLFTLLLVIWAAYLSMFTVDQRQYALVFQFGEIVKTVKEPGINFKIPFMQSVRFFERRVQTIDAEAPDPYNTKEKKNLLVDSFIKWQVADAGQYYRATGGDTAVAENRIKQIVNSRLRDEIGNLTVADVITGKRDEVMANVRNKVNAETSGLGVKVLDVRLKRVDFPDNISGSVYERMKAERRQVANGQRAMGTKEETSIRAEADRQSKVILAEAYRKAEELRGEGDAEAARIYAEAFSQNPEFYAFYKSMQAYQNSFNKKSDVLVLDPSSDFFKYMKSPGGGSAAPAKPVGK